MKANNLNNQSVVDEIRLCVAELNQDLIRQLEDIIRRAYEDKYNTHNAYTLASLAKEQVAVRASRYELEDFLGGVRIDEKRFITFQNSSDLLNKIGENASLLRFGGLYPVVGNEVHLYNNGYDIAYFRQTAETDRSNAFLHSGIAFLCTNPDFGAQSTKLLQRLNAVTKLKENLRKNIKPEDLTSSIKQTVKLCRGSQETWKEKKLLDKLAYLVDKVFLHIGRLFTKPSIQDEKEEKIKQSLHKLSKLTPRN